MLSSIPDGMKYSCVPSCAVVDRSNCVQKGFEERSKISYKIILNFVFNNQVFINSDNQNLK